jgi:hypothetical protein
MKDKICSILVSENLMDLHEPLVAMLHDHGISESMLNELTDSNLCELGIKKIGDRKRLLGAFKCLSLKSSNPLVTPQDNFKYRAEYGQVSITGFTGQGCVVIPDHFTGLPLPVTRIDDGAFRNNGAIVSISLPNTIKEIGKYAFKNCTSLKSIEIPFGVTVINCETFKGCSNLGKLKLPLSIYKIEQEAFCGCSGLRCVELPDSLGNIGPLAFKDCTGLSEVQIPQQTHNFGDEIFDGCTNLSGINCSSHYFWERNSFKDWYNLQRIIIPEGVTEIRREMFAGCENLQEVIIPISVVKIGEWAFKGCSKLERIVLPEGLVEIGVDAFRGCVNIIDFNIPSSVKKIGGSGEEEPLSDFKSGEMSFNNWKTINQNSINKEIVHDGGEYIFFQTYFYVIK